jgi:tRNA(Ile)-lysidine synthase
MPARKIEFGLEYLDQLLFGVLNLDEQGQFYIAYSGGMDSTVLLHAVLGLKERRSLALTALHLDHGLQEESEEWRRRCGSICEQWGVPFESERINLILDRSIGVEASAREARYRWLQSRMSGDVCYLLTAHHQQDQAETFILNLLRGSGVDGLSASTAVTAFGPHKLVRPLLEVSQEAISVYARDNRLAWVTDPSNSDRSFRRNRIRGSVIPVLEEVKADALEQVTTAIKNMQDVQIWTCLG